MFGLYLISYSSLGHANVSLKKFAAIRTGAIKKKPSIGYFTTCVIIRSVVPVDRK